MQLEMDPRTLYKDYVDPATGLLYTPMPSHMEDRFLKHVCVVSELLDEAERTRCKQHINSRLKIKSSRKTDWVFLTVNFDPSKSFAECFKAAQKLGNRRIWEWSCWVHEQRGETPATAGEGHHVHLLAKIKSATASAKSRSKSTVCHVCAVENSAIFNWKYIPEEYLSDKYQYITGAKAIEKQVKQSVDQLWREKNNILSIYSYGKIPDEATATTTTATQEKGEPL